MVKNSDKTYGQLILEAQTKTQRQDVGETLEPLMKQLQDIIEDCVNKQYEECLKKGFNLPKYYIHIFIVKDPLAAQGMGAPNVIRIRSPHCRVTRPSPYQEEDHYLWSVENYSKITFEWCIPNKQTLKYILHNPNQFDSKYVEMLRRYCKGNIEKIEDYLVEDKVI